MARAPQRLGGDIELDTHGIWRAGRRDETLVRWLDVIDAREGWLRNALTLIDRDGRSRLSVPGYLAASTRLYDRVLQHAALDPVPWRGRRFPSPITSWASDLFALGVASAAGLVVWGALVESPWWVVLLPSVISFVAIHLGGVRSVTLDDDAIRIQWVFRHGRVDRADVLRIELAKERFTFRYGWGWRSIVRLHLTRKRTIDLRCSHRPFELYRSLVAWRRSMSEESATASRAD